MLGPSLRIRKNKSTPLGIKFQPKENLNLIHGGGHQAPTNKLKFYVRAIIESGA